MDHRVPRLVTGLYVTGSIALNDYQPAISDMDAVAVCSGRPDAGRREALARLHIAEPKVHHLADHDQRYNGAVVARGRPRPSKSDALRCDAATSRSQGGSGTLGRPKPRSTVCPCPSHELSGTSIRMLVLTALICRLVILVPFASKCLLATNTSRNREPGRRYR